MLGALLFRAHLTWKASSFIAASLAGGVLYAQAKNERRLADARARARRADDATGRNPRESQPSGGNKAL